MECVHHKNAGGLSLPRGLHFGPDNHLYVASGNTDEVLRYEGPFSASPGAVMGAFVSSGSGGLDNPMAQVFGPDGAVYVTSNATDNVLRFDGSSGAFIDEFASSGDGGFDFPMDGSLLFGPDRTGDGNDEVGESSESFELVLSNPTSATIVDDIGVATIIDDDSNNDPVAVDDSASAESEVEQVIDVLANDSDPDGDPIAIDSVESPTAGGGTVVINPDSTLSYTSAPGFTGSDSFSYMISDGQGGTATATVTMDVTAISTTLMFVSDISFQSRKGGKEWRAIFEVRDEFGSVVTGASITVTFAGQTFSGQTDNNGQLRTDWLRLSSGSYEAEVTDLALTDYSWDLTQGVPDSDDSDPYPDGILTF